MGFFSFPSIQDIKELFDTKSDSQSSRDANKSSNQEDAADLLSQKVRDYYIKQFNLNVSFDTTPYSDNVKEGIEGASYKLTKNITTNQINSKRYLMGQVVHRIPFDSVYGINVAYLVSIPSDISAGPTYEIFELLQETEDISGLVLDNFETFASNIFYPLTIDICKSSNAVEGDFAIVERQGTSDLAVTLNPSLNIYHGRFSNEQSDVVPSENTPNKSQESFKRIAEKYKLNLDNMTQSVNLSLSGQSEDLISEFQGVLSLPINQNDVSSLMGIRPNPKKTEKVPGKFQLHKGIDFPGNNMEVKSVFEGTVRVVNRSNIFIEHVSGEKKIYSFYEHLSQILVKQGDIVATGQKIGISGNEGRSTGPHLHLELRETLDGNQINPLFILKGTIKITDELRQRYSFSSNELKLPLDSSRVIIPNPSPPSAVSKASTPIPKAQQSTTQEEILESTPDSLESSPASIPVTSPRMLLVDLKTDFNIYSSSDSKRGSKNIKIREDLYDNLVKIKEILNYFAIPFATQYLDVSIKNEKLSYLGRLGLEFNFNSNATLTPDTNINFADYIIAPNFSRSIYNNGYELQLWGRVRSTADRKSILGYSLEKRELSVYDISRSYKDGKQPEIFEIQGSFLNITKILNDHGFYHASPKYDFFKTSDYTKSNWSIIQSYNRLQVGQTYEEALKKVYIKDRNLSWIGSSDKVWNGKMFVDKKVNNG